ncbi:dihydrofolate reductase family protein [Kribbella sp. NPDC026611]|uniref:dihydrofolate reductase family protein n=1 Tax=Kribbella sp. NPDC026611 TaxID=3154911 RepID=UPI0033EB4F19
MAALVYSAIMSVDGYTTDADGNFDWAAPDEEVHAYINGLERPIGTYLYGRRMYETMAYWETADDDSPVSQEYAAIWRAADKIVYSHSLDSVSTPRTRVERDFTPEAIRTLKTQSTAPLSIGGPTLATTALQAGLVDELHLFLVPTAIGAGLPALPTNFTTHLNLQTTHHFPSGFVHLQYEVEN